MSERDLQKSDWRLIGICSAVLVLVMIGAIWRELRPTWGAAQSAVHAEVATRLGEERTAELTTGLQQIWIEPLQRVDRCVTCHTTIEWGEELAEAPHPARSHPHPDLMAAHPVERFGCTLCHGGQGSATEMVAAHGRTLHWEEPLLDTALAERYGLTRAELMEARCAVCHVTLEPVKGMPLLNAARERLFDCVDCHELPGLPPPDDPKGPSLVRQGEKHPTDYTFPKDWSGPHTALEWHIQHLLEPAAVTPGSAMTRFKMSRKEAAGLALIVMSWKRHGLPADYVPRGEE
jgi:hypothetical protein